MKEHLRNLNGHLLLAFADDPESHIPVIHPVTPQACGTRRHNSVALLLFVDLCGAASPSDFGDR